MGDSLCKKLLNHYQANDGSECTELFDTSPSIAWQKLGNPMRNSDGIPPIKSVQRTLLFISSNYWKPVTRRLTARFHCSAAVMQGRQGGGFNKINTSDLTVNCSSSSSTSHLIQLSRRTLKDFNYRSSRTYKCRESVQKEFLDI